MKYGSENGILLKGKFCKHDRKLNEPFINLCNVIIFFSTILDLGLNLFTVSNNLNHHIIILLISKSVKTMNGSLKKGGTLKINVLNEPMHNFAHTFCKLHSTTWSQYLISLLSLFLLPTLFESNRQFFKVPFKIGFFQKTVRSALNMKVTSEQAFGSAVHYLIYNQLPAPCHNKLQARFPWLFAKNLSDCRHSSKRKRWKM